MSYFDPAGLARIGNLELIAKQVVEGFLTNIKITTKADIYLADAILKSLPKPKVKGPIHPFAEEEMWK